MKEKKPKQWLIVVTICVMYFVTTPINKINVAGEKMKKQMCVNDRKLDRN